MNIASIDIGTNTVLLLIAEVNIDTKKIIPRFNQYEMPRIGRGLLPGEPISDKNLEALVSVLESYHVHILKYKCENILVTATSAIRIASNSESIKRSLKTLFNFELEIISGDQEAEFAFLGALSGSPATKDSIVIDIGGGSTEIIFGNLNKIFFKKSFQIGSVSSTEKFLTTCPPSVMQLNNLKKELIHIFQEIKGRFLSGHVIAIAGTATTLACMKSKIKDFDEAAVEGSSLNHSDLKYLINEMAKLTAHQILQKFGSVMKGREDIILAGAIILQNIMKILEVNELIVSSRGIRYGAIINFIMKNRT